MKTKLCRLWACFVLAALCLIPLFSLGAAAASAPAVPLYTNPETGYSVYILDDDNLLTDSEESQLREQMQNITAYGDIIFWSTSENTFDEIEQAKNKRYQICGNKSSGIFVINMKVRMVTFQSDGDIFAWVTASKARSITDNVSHYASEKQYYRCASEGLSQVYEVLRGNAIAEPMKYISYTVIGLMIAFVLVVGIVFGTSLNPLARKNKETAKLIGSGNLFAERPRFTKTGSSQRAWVLILLILLESLLHSGGGSSGGGHSSGGGGHSGGGGGGGGGGSSRF